MKLKELLDLIDCDEIVLEIWCTTEWLFDCNKRAEVLKPYRSWIIDYITPMTVKIDDTYVTKLAIGILKELN